MGAASPTTPSEPPRCSDGCRGLRRGGTVGTICLDVGLVFVSVEGTNGTQSVAGARFFVSDSSPICPIIALNSFGIGLSMGHLCPGFGPLVFPLSGAFGWGATLTQGLPWLAKEGPIWMVWRRGTPVNGQMSLAWGRPHPRTKSGQGLDSGFRLNDWLSPSPHALGHYHSCLHQAVEVGA